MIAEKLILDKLLKRLVSGGVGITYWDGTSKNYGPARPYFHVTIHTPKVVRSMARDVSLGFGEGYMNGELEIDGKLDQVVRLSSENNKLFPKLPMSKLLRRASSRKSHQQANIAHHYDLGNDFYKLWLDDSMTYSCAYFKTPRDSLEKAQQQKVDHLLRKLQLEKGQKLLDIGSGWGNLLFRAAEIYGVKGHGITLSQEQYDYCVAETKRRGLTKQLKFELLNYQDLAARGGQYDRIISVGMFEHVGRHNQKLYLQAVHDLLRDGGVSVLHAITSQSDKPADAWIDRYIFPGGHLATVPDIIRPFDGLDFTLMDYENLKYHYAMTLDEWWRRFEKHKTKVIERYGEQFYRMWRFWLASSSASFRYGELSLSQLVFVKNIREGYPLTRRHLYLDD